MYVVSKLFLENPVCNKNLGTCEVKCLSKLFTGTDYAAVISLETRITMSFEVHHQLSHHISTIRVESSHLPREYDDANPTALNCQIKLREIHNSFIRKIDDTIVVAKETIAERLNALTSLENKAIEGLTALTLVEQEEIISSRASFNSPLAAHVRTRRLNPS